MKILKTHTFKTSWPALWHPCLLITVKQTCQVTPMVFQWVPQRRQTTFITALASDAWFRFGPISVAACSRLGWCHRVTLFCLCQLTTPCSWGKCPPRQRGCGRGRGSRQADLRCRQFRHLGCRKSEMVKINGQNKVGLMICTCTVNIVIFRFLAKSTDTSH